MWAWHAWAAAVLRIPLDLDRHAVAHRRSRRLAQNSIQVQIETSIPGRHQVDAMCFRRFVVDPHQHRHRFAPARLQLRRTGRAHPHQRFDPANLNPRVEANRARNSHFRSTLPCLFSTSIKRNPPFPTGGLARPLSIGGSPARRCPISRVPFARELGIFSDRPTLPTSG
jgi:hypothetical protein